MKKLLLVLAAMMSLTSLAQAQSLAHLDENRRREIETRNKLNGQGHLVPGQPGGGYPAPPGHPGHGGNPYPGNPYPGNPYPNPYPGQPHQPPYPGYNDVYGPAVTYRWLDMGTHKAQKLVDTNIHLSVRGQLVNEIFVTAQNNPVLIRSAIAYLSNGQAIELRSLLGNIHENRPVRTVLDYRNSLRVESIVLNVEAASLLGSRGKLNIQLGLAQ
jgi:hypothetical protein